MTSTDASLCQTVICTDCKTSESTYWHKNGNDTLCNICYTRQKEKQNRSTRSNSLLSSTSSISKTSDEIRAPDICCKTGTVTGSSSNATRKSSRLKPSARSKPWQSAMKSSTLKGRSKRFIFKKNPVKSSVSIATVVTSDYIFHDGSYWQVGDIVAVTDVDDGQQYYAQLRGFLQDEFYMKSAVITWLVPQRKRSNSDKFDPAQFIAGPDEELPRSMEHFEFICHAPSDYFKYGVQYRTSCASDTPLLGCIWTSFGPKIETVESVDALLGVKTADSEDSTRCSMEDSKLLLETEKRSPTVREKTRSQKASLTRLKDRLAK